MAVAASIPHGAPNSIDSDVTALPQRTTDRSKTASLLSKNPNPTKDEVVAHMDGNLCRCMTYSRIQKAIMRAASEMRTASNAGNERRAT